MEREELTHFGLLGVESRRVMVVCVCLGFNPLNYVRVRVKVGVRMSVRLRVWVKVRVRVCVCMSTHVYVSFHFCTLE